MFIKSAPQDILQRDFNANAMEMQWKWEGWRLQCLANHHFDKFLVTRPRERVSGSRLQIESLAENNIYKIVRHIY